MPRPKKQVLPTEESGIKEEPISVHKKEEVKETIVHPQEHKNHYPPHFHKGPPYHRYERKPQDHEQSRRAFQQQKPKLKSEGEQMVADFLASERIHFVYEYPVALIDEQEQVRLWYPDFFLPKLNIVIEYLGMKGKPEYERAVRRKTKLFRQLQMDFILITPKRLTRPDWKHYIVGKILEIMDSKESEYNKMKILSRKYKYKSVSIGDDWGLG